jgi:hypothetical protein
LGTGELVEPFQFAFGASPSGSPGQQGQS